MNLTFKNTTAIVFAGLAASLMFLHTPVRGQAPDGKQAAKGKGGFGGRSSDPRVQNRTYHFADAGEDLPYCVFVSSKVSKDKKNPRIVTLHGLGISYKYKEIPGADHGSVIEAGMPDIFAFF
jgi:hypothetical protein